MTVKVKIRNPDPEDKRQSYINLQIRRSLGGDYMIFDHADINIIVKPGEGKIVTMGKEEIENTDMVYDAQNRMFKYLTTSGVVDPATIKGGDLYGTLEAEYHQKDAKPNSTQVAVFMIGKFIEEERPYFIFRQAQEEIEIEKMADPDDEYTTDLGEVPHATQKGTIYPNDFPSGANYRVYQENLEKEVSKLFLKYREKK